MGETGPVIFRCPETGRDFDSGFRAKPADFDSVPTGATVRLRCRICGRVHTFPFDTARIGPDQR